MFRQLSSVRLTTPEKLQAAGRWLQKSAMEFDLIIVASQSGCHKEWVNIQGKFSTDTHHRITTARVYILPRLSDYRGQGIAIFYSRVAKLLHRVVLGRNR